MWEWFFRLFDPPEPTPPPSPAPPLAALPPPAVAPEVVETLEVTRKNARAQAKLAARVDEVDAALVARLDALRAAVDALATARPSAAPTTTPAAAWGEILDAMDLLQRAVDGLPPDRDDGLAEGLRGVLRRLDRALALGRVERQGEVGGAVDGRLFRVIGTEFREGLPEGRIARVVRAAALLDGKVLREGEIFSTRTSP